MRTKVSRICSFRRLRLELKGRRCGRIRTHLCTLAIAQIALAAASLSRAESQPPPISPEELASLWEGQRTEISTAVVRFQCFNTELENPANTPEHVAQLLSDHDLVRDPDQLEPFLVALFGRPFEVASPTAEMSLTVSGRRRRVSGGFTDFVTDGDLEAEYMPSNGQVTLSPPGKSAVHHWDLSDLRWTPPPGISSESWNFLRVEDDVAVVEVPPREDGTAFMIDATLDIASGVVTHKMTRYADGKPAVEMYQSGLEVLSSGIVFPRVRINLTYTDGIVRLARVMLIHSARFNEPVDAAAFALELPERTTVVDFRTAEKSVYRTKTAELDALALPVRNLDSPPRSAPAMSASSSPKLRWLILIGVHLAVLLILGAVFLRRRRAVAMRRP